MFTENYALLFGKELDIADTLRFFTIKKAIQQTCL